MRMVDKVTERRQSLMGTSKPGDGKGDEVGAAVKDVAAAMKDATVRIEDVMEGD